MLTDLAPTRAEVRRVGPYTSDAHRRRYFVILASLVLTAAVVTFLILSWGNEYELFSDKWWRISGMRVTALVIIAVVTFCQAFATVPFQTVTNNRILTPSIMGFEALYVLLQTAVVYYFGSYGFLGESPFARFLLQVALMVLLAVILYSWLLSGRLSNLHIMLLIGIVIGMGMQALSTFMQRMLEPNEFDILRARLYGSISNANDDFLWFVIPVCAASGILIWMLAGRLNVIALGSDISTNLGLHHRRQVMVMLTLVAVLMAMSVSLVGPMTFLGFLIATFAYSATDTYDHRRILPMAWLLGYVILAIAYFLLRHVLVLVDAVTIVVELIGGLVFLIVVLRKGRL